MSRRTVLYFMLAAAAGFSTGWVVRNYSSPTIYLEVRGQKQSAFGDLNAKPNLEDLPWISPTIAVARCGIRQFDVSNGSDGVEQVTFAIAQASNEQSNCVLNLATRPSKHPLQFQFSESKL